MLKLYGYKKCGTCRRAEKALTQLNVGYEFIDITETPPSASALKKILKHADMDIKKLFNTSGVQYRELKIKDQLSLLSDAEKFTMLANNGRLVKRPIVTDGKKATIGFNEEIFNRTWGNKDK